MSKSVEAAELKAFDNAARSMISHEESGRYGVSYGVEYDPDMTVKECAAAIRKTLRKHSKAKHSPLAGAKVSVRYSSFAGGSAIDVKLGLPYRVTATEQEKMVNAPYGSGVKYAYLTPKASAAKATAEEIHEAYGFDGSDTMTDYFHVKYYGNVTVHELKEGE